MNINRPFSNSPGPNQAPIVLNRKKKVENRPDVVTTALKILGAISAVAAPFVYYYSNPPQTSVPPAIDLSHSLVNPLPPQLPPDPPTNLPPFKLPPLINLSPSPESAAESSAYFLPLAGAVLVISALWYCVRNPTTDSGSSTNSFSNSPFRRKGDWKRKPNGIKEPKETDHKKVTRPSLPTSGRDALTTFLEEPANFSESHDEHKKVTRPSRPASERDKLTTFSLEEPDADKSLNGFYDGVTKLDLNDQLKSKNDFSEDQRYHLFPWYFIWKNSSDDQDAASSNTLLNLENDFPEVKKDESPGLIQSLWESLSNISNISFFKDPYAGMYDADGLETLLIDESSNPIDELSTDIRNLTAWVLKFNDDPSAFSVEKREKLLKLMNDTDCALNKLSSTQRDEMGEFLIELSLAREAFGEVLKESKKEESGNQVLLITNDQGQAIVPFRQKTEEVQGVQKSRAIAELERIHYTRNAVPNEMLERLGLYTFLDFPDLQTAEQNVKAFDITTNFPVELWDFALNLPKETLTFKNLIGDCIRIMNEEGDQLYSECASSQISEGLINSLKEMEKKAVNENPEKKSKYCIYLVTEVEWSRFKHDLQTTLETLRETSKKHQLKSIEDIIRQLEQIDRLLKKYDNYNTLKDDVFSSLKIDSALINSLFLEMRNMERDNFLKFLSALTTLTLKGKNTNSLLLTEGLEKLRGYITARSSREAKDMSQGKFGVAEFIYNYCLTALFPTKTEEDTFKSIMFGNKETGGVVVASTRNPYDHFTCSALTDVGIVKFDSKGSRKEPVDEFDFDKNSELVLNKAFYECCDPLPSKEISVPRQSDNNCYLSAGWLKFCTFIHFFDQSV